jgi:hypothetical protein
LLLRAFLLWLLEAPLLLKQLSTKVLFQLLLKLILPPSNYTLEVLLLDQLVELHLTMVFLLLVMAQKMVKNTILSKTLGDHHGVLMVTSSLELRLVTVSVVSKCNLLSQQLIEINLGISIKYVYPDYLILINNS